MSRADAIGYLDKRYSHLCQHDLTLASKVPRELYIRANIKTVLANHKAGIHKGIICGRIPACFNTLS